VRGLLLGVQAQLAALLALRAGGRRGRGVGEREDRVAVLAGVMRQLAVAQLSGTPALVERVLQHVDRCACLIEPCQDVH
jgi:hypothetical protein